ncbi:hypothetical protein WR25_10611 [Diploscapter pachys]|uniref:Uncharacterized protein n=1 Tax=Diploscapter pachys TaxID=2018661 RepID=A0A2A2JFD6_9BILA|nr:hypothetical protein WR25_10611 [Diploscapter pachys]
MAVAWARDAALDVVRIRAKGLTDCCPLPLPPPLCLQKGNDERVASRRENMTDSQRRKWVKRGLSYLLIRVSFCRNRHTADTNAMGLMIEKSGRGEEALTDMGKYRMKE